MLALYARALTPDEAEAHYHLGPNVVRRARVAEDVNDPDVLQFETRIAPLLADNCLECHDTARSEGELDLSRREAVKRGGSQGPVLDPGNAEGSLIWQMVADNEMPYERPPLTSDEKKLLKDWIDSGATWTLRQIDPAVYAHGAGQEFASIRRLTVPEYIESVRAAVGVDIEDEANRLLPGDVRTDGFSNTAYNLQVDLRHVQAYASLADHIVKQLDSKAFVSRFVRRTRFTDDDMGRLVERMGAWVLRGSLSDEEISQFRGIMTTVAASGGTFHEAGGLVVEAMLQSPRFLYRVENHIGNGLRLPVTSHELASRISYAVWGAPPDEELNKVAESGSLLDDHVMHVQLDRMFADRRARLQALRFFSEWLDLKRLDDLQPSKSRFPDWDTDLSAAMRAETLAYIDEVVWQQSRPLADLLNAQFTYVTPRLARHYGIGQLVTRSPVADDAGKVEIRQTVLQAADNTVPSGVSQRLVRVDLSNVPERGGILTQGSFLTLGGDDASMVTRGLFMLHELLRGVVKDPPPGVDTVPPDTAPGVTQRAIAEQRIADSQCGGCHARFEPLAYGMERFDGLGRYATEDEHGNRLRDDGEFMVPGTGEPIPYRTVGELMDRLASSSRVRHTMTWKVTQFLVGRPLGGRDAAAVDSIHQRSQEMGGRYQDVVRAILGSDLVRTVQTEPERPVDAS